MKTRRSLKLTRTLNLVTVGIRSVCFALFLASITVSSSTAQVAAPDKVARIGALAFRGSEAAKAQWQPLANYLTDSIEGWRFVVVPVTLVSAEEELKSNSLEFLITNPGHYITLSDEFDISVLATRERRSNLFGAGLLRYGTAIFALESSDIDVIDDLRGKRIAAVSPEAFGGFQLAWHEMVNQGIDPFADFESVRFQGFPQDEIVYAVLSGEVDAGIIRSGLLEELASEGNIKLPDFVVLQNNSQLGYPNMVSGRLYPEWPFTANSWVDKELRETVLHALLETQQPDLSVEYSLLDIWSAPLAYEDVRRLASAYRDREVSDETTTDIDTLSLFILLIVGISLVLLIIRMAMQIIVKKDPLTEPVQVAEHVKDALELAEIRQRFERLTKREVEILTMICAGKASKEIAANLGISPKTVEYHRSNLLQKTDAGTTARLVQLATRLDHT